MKEVQFIPDRPGAERGTSLSQVRSSVLRKFRCGKANQKEGTTWAGNYPAWAAGNPPDQAEARWMPYFLASRPKARRSLPASRAAWVTFPACFTSICRT